VSLTKLEQWMLTVVSHPEGVEAGVKSGESTPLGVSRDSLHDAVLPGPELSAMECLDIYTYMYHWRLVEALEQQFPATQHALGETCFHDTCVAYLQKHPSRHYRLKPLGEHFADYLASQESLPNAPFVSQLAQLERLSAVVFDAPQREPISQAAVQAVPPEQWIEAQFQVIPALRLQRFDYPVNAYHRAAQDAQAPQMPPPQESWVLIWRMNYSVLRSDLTREQFTLLKALQDGHNLADALDACSQLPNVDPDAVVPHLGAWFKEWTQDGVFAAVTVP